MLCSYAAAGEFVFRLYLFRLHCKMLASASTLSLSYAAPAAPAGASLRHARPAAAPPLMETKADLEALAKDLNPAVGERPAPRSAADQPRPPLLQPPSPPRRCRRLLGSARALRLQLLGHLSGGDDRLPARGGDQAWPHRDGRLCGLHRALERHPLDLRQGRRVGAHRPARARCVGRHPRHRQVANHPLCRSALATAARSLRHGTSSPHGRRAASHRPRRRSLQA